jgi:uncharacterized protein YqeY
MSDIKATLMADIKTCLKGGDKPRLAVLRLISSAVKQREVDERVDTDDAAMIQILDKMAKQRRESIEQFEAASRQDLADAEKRELEIIQTYLPEQMSSDEIDTLINEAMAATGASGMRDMGKVMGMLKPKLQGRADMSAVSAQIKARLNG